MGALSWVAGLYDGGSPEPTESEQGHQEAIEQDWVVVLEGELSALLRLIFVCVCERARDPILQNVCRHPRPRHHPDGSSAAMPSARPGPKLNLSVALRGQHRRTAPPRRRSPRLLVSGRCAIPDSPGKVLRTRHYRIRASASHRRRANQLC